MSQPSCGIRIGERWCGHELPCPHHPGLQRCTNAYRISGIVRVSIMDGIVRGYICTRRVLPPDDHMWHQGYGPDTGDRVIVEWIDADRRAFTTTRLDVHTWIERLR